MRAPHPPTKPRTIIPNQASGHAASHQPSPFLYPTRPQAVDAPDAHGVERGVGGGVVVGELAGVGPEGLGLEHLWVFGWFVLIVCLVGWFVLLFCFVLFVLFVWLLLLLLLFFFS